MKIFGINFGKGPELAVTPVPGMAKGLAVTPAEWLRGAELDNGPALTNAYEQVVWVYRAINVLAEQVANIPFVFSAGERGRENLITSGPLPEFYARPHPQLNRFQYWELRVIWLLLRGECFRIPIYQDEAGQDAPAPLHAGARLKLSRILLLDPAHFRHIVEDHQLLGWRYTGCGPRAPLASQLFLPEEVWFEKLPNPFDFWRGLGPLSVAGMAARAEYAAGAFMRGVIENNGDTGVIVRTDQPLGDEQQAEILAALRERKRRAGAADRPLFLNGVTEIVKPQLSSTDLQFLENRKFSRGEICAAFGVPEEIVTTTDTAKYDVMAGARLNFVENRVAPLCSRLEAEEEATIKRIDPLATGWFDLDSLPILQEARRQRLAAARAGFEMGVPFNELNRVLDLGFKPLPWGERGYVSGKLHEVGGGSPATQAQPPASNAGTPPSRSGFEPAAEGLSFPLRFQAREDPLARAEELLEALQPPLLSPAGSQLTRRLRRFLFEQRRRVLGRWQTHPLADGNILENPLDISFEDAELTAAIEPLLETLLGEARSQFCLDELPEPCVKQYVRGRLAALLAVNRAMSEALGRSLREGKAAGETADELTARLKAHYNEAGSRGAPRLAEAELAAARAAAARPEIAPAGLAEGISVPPCHLTNA